MDIILKPRHLTVFFSCIVVCLTLAHIAIQCSYLTHGDKSVFEPLVPFFDFNAEHNIPTFFSSVSLLFGSLLLTIITFAKKRSGERYIHWLGLVVILLFLSIDELMMIHDRLNTIVRSGLNISGLTFSAWIIPYAAASIIFLLVYVKFVFNLPARTRLLFIIGLSTYVLSAMGFEIAENRLFDLYGPGNITFVVLYTIEELLEMTSIVIFIYALTSYIDLHLKGLRLSIKSSN